MYAIHTKLALAQIPPGQTNTRMREAVSWMDPPISLLRMATVWRMLVGRCPLPHPMVSRTTEETQATIFCMSLHPHRRPPRTCGSSQQQHPSCTLLYTPPLPPPPPAGLWHTPPACPSRPHRRPPRACSGSQQRRPSGTPPRQGYGTPLQHAPPARIGGLPGHAAVPNRHPSSTHLWYTPLAGLWHTPSGVPPSAGLWHTPSGAPPQQGSGTPPRQGFGATGRANGPGISNPKRGLRADKKSQLAPLGGQISLGGIVDSQVASTRDQDKR